MSEEKQLYGADLVVDSLINHDVDYVFGIPGAKIDKPFLALCERWFFNSHRMGNLGARFSLFGIYFCYFK